MKLLLLGTTGYHPCDRRQTACFMLPEIGVVLDAGTAMYRVREHLVTETLHIYLTHAHLDHIVGLSFLFDVIEGRPTERVVIHGEQEKLDAVKDHLFSKLLFPVMPPFETVALNSKEVLPDGATVKHFPLKHPGGSVGYRIDWPDRSLAYVTDTVASADATYIEHIRGVDLLIHECYFGDGMDEQAEVTGHSCLTPVAQVAAASGAGRTVLVHINPMLENDRDLRLDEARRICPGLEIGTDGMEIEF